MTPLPCAHSAVGSYLILDFCHATYPVTLLSNFTLRIVTWIKWLEKDISSTANIFRQVEAFFHSDQKKALFRKLYSLEINACHSPKMISFLLYSPPNSVLVLSKSEIAWSAKRVHSAAFPTQLSFLHPVPTFFEWPIHSSVCPGACQSKWCVWWGALLVHCYLETGVNDRAIDQQKSGLKSMLQFFSGI